MIRFCKASCALICILLFLGSIFPLHAGGSSHFRLSWSVDSILLGSGLLLNLGSMYVTDNAVPPSLSEAGTLPASIFPYSRILDDTGTIGSAAGVLTLPFLPDRFTLNETAVIGVMYLETFLLAWGSKDLLKGLFPANRPYMYRGDTPAELFTDSERYFSFPSGHTTIAFSTAGFATYVFSRSRAGTTAKILFGIGSFTLAAAVGALRVSSGSHFMEDVFAGALIGTACGFFVPWLHEVR